MHSDYLLLRPVDSLEYVISQDYDTSLQTCLVGIPKKSHNVLFENGV